MSSVRIALVVGAVALLVGIADWEAYGYYDYYVFLRFLICGISIFAAYVSLRERSALAFPFLLVGILFNPIVRAHLTREIWIGLDLVVAMGFLATARLASRLDSAKMVISAARTPEAETQPAEAAS